MNISHISAAAAFALATSFAGASAWAQAGQSGNQNQQQGNTGGQGQSGSLNQTVNLTPSDKAFLSNEARSVNAQIEYGKLAQQNGSSPEVKKLGQRMVTDGQANLAQLQGFAKASGVMLPIDMQASDRQVLENLKNLQGQAFDQQFTSRVQQRERTEFSRLQVESNAASNPELRAYANKQMSTAQLMIDESKNIGVTEKQGPNKGNQQQQNPPQQQQQQNQPQQNQPQQNQPQQNQPQQNQQPQNENQPQQNQQQQEPQNEQQQYQP